MKKLLIIIISLYAWTGSLFCQMVTTVPAVPTMGRVIKIYFDASYAEAGTLRNYTGDLYVHTGVTLNGTNWQKVIGSWGVNSTQPKLTSLGNYRYELQITPDIKTFYGLAETDVVTKICLVFRSADATKQTSPDIFIDVFTAGLNATFTLPEKFSNVAELNDLIPVKAAATMADSVTLYINGEYIKSGITPDEVTYTFNAYQYGEYWVKVIAWDKPSFSADSFFVYVRGPIVTEALPAGLMDGINYTSNSSVILVLHAPYKESVFVTGDFTDWIAREKGYMKRTPDTERYWLEITGLEPGKEYRFQYFVNSELYIADPYADKLLDPWNDQYITSDTYPDLISYPKDTASGMVSVLQTAQVPYTWQASGYQPPDKSKLVIYELLIRDFIAKHDFKTLTDTLSYLDDLGVNAIELMPVSEFEGNLSWGYNPSFYFAPDKYYGPKNDFKAFVDSCHKRGIAVIMDMVLNHCNGQSPFVQLYLDYYGSDQIYMKLPNPWFNASSPNPVYKWGADFNHQSVATQNLVDRINAYWLTEYNIDGFRFDFSKGYTNTPGDGSSYDASRITILKRMAGKIWSVKTGAYVILEHFAPDSEEKELANYGTMLWSNNNYNYGEAAMGYTSDLTYASYLGRGWTVPNLVSYMESHDEERLMYKTITYGSVSPDYNIRNQKIALKRMELDALFFLTVPGPKMIWQFGELGYDISIDYGGRISEKPILWDYYSQPERHRLFLFYKVLNNLRKNHPVFTTTSFTYSLSSPLKRLQLCGTDMCVNILGNFGVTQSSIDPAFIQTGKWYDYFSGDSITVSDVNAQISLEAGEYRLYSTVRLPSPDLILDIEDNVLPGSEVLLTAYPNPSEDVFNFLIQNDIPGPVTITILDMTGRIIRQMNTEASRSEIITWDGKSANGSEAPEGFYIVQIRSGKKTGIVKIIKN
jgi:glycosidase